MLCRSTELVLSWSNHSLDPAAVALLPLSATGHLRNRPAILEIPLDFLAVHLSERFSSDIVSLLETLL